MDEQSHGQGTWASPFLGTCKPTSNKEKVPIGVSLLFSKAGSSGSRFWEVTGATGTWYLVWGLVRQIGKGV